MLLETVLHEQFISYLTSKKIEFSHEVKIYNGTIDFKVNFGGRIAGVEAKADRGNVPTTVGQLVNAKRTFSDVYLLTTQAFFRKIIEPLKEFGLDEQFGFIILKDNDFVLNKPRVKQYYFNEEYVAPVKTKRTKTLVMGKKITDFLEKYKEKHFLCADVARDMNISMPYAQQRIAHWRRFALVIPVQGTGNPKSFKVLRIPKEKYAYV